MPASRTAIERVRYWQGQTLRSRDFNDQLSHDASLRWWHNRAIHNTYGIVAGLRSGVHQEQIVIAPGLAYDCFGRELLCLDRRSIAPPPDEPDGPESWRLVLRAASSQLLTPTPLDFRWLPAAEPLSPDQGVILAVGSWTDGEFRLEGRRQQPSTRSLSRPRLGSGATVHGKTDWREWSVVGSFGRRSVSGVQVTVNTAAAGFKQTPCYFAFLRGDPWIRSGGSVLIGLERVVEATPRSFVFSLWIQPLFRPLSTPSVAEAPAPLAQLGRRQWSVCWLGIEATRTVFTEVPKS